MVNCLVRKVAVSDRNSTQQQIFPNDLMQFRLRSPQQSDSHFCNQKCSHVPCAAHDVMKLKDINF